MRKALFLDLRNGDRKVRRVRRERRIVLSS
jgi:hypothetical protein